MGQGAGEPDSLRPGLWVVTCSSGKNVRLVSTARGTLFTVANWRKNHVISMTTFTDDLDIGESVRSAVETAAIERRTLSGLEI